MNSIHHKGSTTPICPSTYRAAVSLFCLLILLAACLLFHTRCHAFCTETKAVIYLPVPVGGQIDTLYTPLLEAWERNGEYTLAQERAPGRGGSYALSRLLLDARDECALAAIQIPSFLFLTRAPNRMAREDEITPIGMFAYAPHALWVKDDSPLHTLADLAALAHKEDQGRRRLIIAGVGSYTDQHLASLALDRALGIKSVYYPLSSTVEAVTLTERSLIHACWGYALPPQSMPGMRPIAVAARGRSAALPDTPTFQEQNLDFSSGSHFGIAMASSTPELIQKKMSDRLASLLTDPSLQKRYAGLGASPLALVNDELKAFVSLHTREAKKLLEQYPLIPRYYLGN